jgi:hypothetical protein
VTLDDAFVALTGRRLQPDADLANHVSTE